VDTYMRFSLRSQLQKVASILPGDDPRTGFDTLSTYPDKPL